jgi:branched-chain amino acid aminotransferase
MVNINGTLVVTDEANISLNNRGFAYGDAVFETIRLSNGKILFWEDHYFRLMASMRIVRMDIPMSFTLEFLENEVFKVLESNSLSNKSARVKLTVARVEGGLYAPNNNDVNFYISVSERSDATYLLAEDAYNVDLYKDNYVSPTILSTLKTNNKVLNVIASVYAKENQLENCLLLNTNKSVVEALNGNLFLVKGSVIKTPPLADGCLKGIMRKQIIDIIKLIPEFTLEEASISPFELQKADELFITNVMVGIQPISKYRKKSFSNTVAKNLLAKLNAKVRLS